SAVARSDGRAGNTQPTHEGIDGPVPQDGASEQPLSLEADDPQRRMEINLEYWGTRGADFHEKLLRIARAEAEKSLQRLKSGAAPGPTWVNLGPFDSRFEQRRTELNAGRLRSIHLDPRSSDVAYVAAAGGGVWKTFNLTSPDPTWIPITDLL